MVDKFDYAVIALAAFVIIAFSVLYTEARFTGSEIRIEAEFNDSENVYLEGVFNSTTTTIRSSRRATTTTTLAVLVGANVGAPVVAVSTGFGSVMINCGGAADFIDRLYLRDFMPVRYAYMTSMGDENIGGCAGGFMSYMPGDVYDPGGKLNSNYNYIVGDKRNQYVIGDKFRLINVNGSVVSQSGGDFSIFMEFGGVGLLYLDGCDNCTHLINQFRPEVLVVDDNIEFGLDEHYPDYVVGKFNGMELEGVNLVDLSNGEDFFVYVDADSKVFKY